MTPGVPAGAATSDAAPQASGGRRSGSDSRSRLVDKVDMAHFADTLTAFPAVGRPVLDKTGLQGVYMVHLEWDSDDDLMSAVEEQLGLKFEPRKALVDILVVDRIEKPAGN